MLYNFGGYLGYLVLGYYLHTYPLSQMKNLLIGSLFCLVGGYFTYKGLLYTMQYPEQITWIQAEGQKVEFFINNLTINVVMMTAGTFMLLQTVSLSGISKKIVAELSQYSYGIFLVHYIINVWVIHWIKTGTGMEISPWIGQPLLALGVFIASYIVIKILSYLPKSKLLTG